VPAAAHRCARTDPLPHSEKAAKAAAKSEKDGSSKGTTTTNGSSTATPLTNTSAATSVEDLSDMKKLAVATERNASGVLTSDKQSRDIHIDNFTMSFHGRLLVDGAEIVLNYGQR
jgi:ATP-binding cassette subfamily F protein 2